MKTSFLSALIIGFCAVTPTLAAQWEPKPGKPAFPFPLQHRAPARRHHQPAPAREHHHQARARKHHHLAPARKHDHLAPARKHHHLAPGPKDPALDDSGSEDSALGNPTPKDPASNDPASKDPASKNQRTCRVPGIGKDLDSGPNIRKAFDDCQNNSKIILDSYYVVATLIATPRLLNVEIELTGTIDFVDNLGYWSGAIYHQTAPTFFDLQGDNIHLHGTVEALKAGGSAFNGRGQRWWNTFAANQKRNNAGGSSTTLTRPTLFTIEKSTNVLVDNLAFYQAPSWFILIDNSKHVTMDSIIISAVSNAAFPMNTDGVNIYRSTDVKLTHFKVTNGDDCIAVKSNTTNIEVGYMTCYSNGMSVGSLGQYRYKTDTVENVSFHDIVMTDALYGSLIKLWPDNNSADLASGGGSGYVKNVTFKNFHNENVTFPLILTSCFYHGGLGPASYCAENPSKVKVSDVHYINVTGTSSGRAKNLLATLDCAQTCTDITAKGTLLTLPTDRYGPPVYACTNVASKNQLDFTPTEV